MRRKENTAQHTESLLFFREYSLFYFNASLSRVTASPTKNTFRSSIFHLFPLTPLIINAMTWWKIAFSACLSSTRIFHLPPVNLSAIQSLRH
ncbi:hypothetical protein BUN20_00285 [Bacteroides fragilis]|uniref:Uncharacterized protein n=1 Tax=Bacteroides fragilis TaxID=817 RepID=A0A2K9H4A5_BACFG|nr:hypothetical protein BUN20_00285 [Bacteroides fragilis]QLK85044.1 hypothetical protein DBK98_007975 [Bacteroides sp. PHL 2737]QCQ34464.1 hypothetical protein IB64_007595 [Bacteroides fragilis]QCQ47560.1 hypothetical protein EC80_007505 [Bacteroides fragilis]QCQ52160.1 hypothetical protein EE52_006890 [Bacteroides fragilis]